MKKVGLITYHDTSNHGAALQLFASLKKINDLGYRSEVIHYTNSHRLSIYNVKERMLRELAGKQLLPALKTLLGSGIINSRKAAFEKFYDEHTPRNSIKYLSNTDLNLIQSGFDCFVCGSDQIWSPKNNGQDLTYLLNFVDEKNKTMSYASSFGSVEIPENILPEYKRLLSSFKHLSVREETGADLIQKIIHRNATVVMDPVFLLSESEWLDLLGDRVNERESLETTLLDYTATHGMLDKFLKLQGVASKFTKIDKIGTSIKLKDFCSRNICTHISAGPIDFIRKVYNTDFLFTSSFHGTVLAIIFKKPFISILSGDSGRDSRIYDLLVKFKLTSRIFDPNMSIEDIDAPIDFEAVHTLLNKNKEISLSYLTSALDDIVSD